MNVRERYKYIQFLAYVVRELCQLSEHLIMQLEPAVVELIIIGPLSIELGKERGSDNVCFVRLPEGADVVTRNDHAVPGPPSYRRKKLRGGKLNLNQDLADLVNCFM